MTRPQDHKRYSRQTCLTEVGDRGQERLANSSVLCVGVGGLGCPTSLYLAAAGVGRIGLIDPDRVDESNLQRQVLFGSSSLKQFKVEAAKARLSDLNPGILLETYPKRLDAANALEVFSGYDIIIDGTDNFVAKFLINDAAAKLGIPVVFGSISRFEGQVSVFWAGKGPCYRCLYPEPPRAKVANCAEAGVIGAVAGAVGSLQAMEAMKLLLAKDSSHSGLEPLIGRLLILDLATMRTSTFRVPARAHCKTCSVPADRILLEDAKATVCESALVDHAMEEVSVERFKTDPTWSSAHLLDVREFEEWRAARLPGAEFFPLSSLEAGKTPKLDAKRACLVYCRSGIRSRRAIEILRARGHAAPLGNLTDGILSWDGPVERG